MTPSQRLVHPLTLPPSSTALKQLRDRTPPLGFFGELLELGVVALHVRLDAHLQLDIVPVGVALLALDQHVRAQVPLDGDLPLAELDAQVLGHEGAGHLGAGAQARERVGEWRRGGVLAAEGWICVHGDLVRASLDGDRLGDSCAFGVDPEGHFLPGDWGAGELTGRGSRW